MKFWTKMKVWKFHHVYSPKAWIMPKVKAEVMELHATIWMKRINVILWFKKRLQRIKRVWLILSRSIEKKWARAKVDIEERKHLHRRHKKFLLIIKNKAIPKLRKLLKKLKIAKINEPRQQHYNILILYNTSFYHSCKLL